MLVITHIKQSRKKLPPLLGYAFELQQSDISELLQ